MNRERYIFAAVLLTVVALLFLLLDFHSKATLEMEKADYRQQMRYAQQLVPLKNMWADNGSIKRLQRRIQSIPGVTVRKKAKVLYVTAPHLSQKELKRLVRLVCSQPVIIKKWTLMHLNPNELALRMVLK